MKGGKERKGKEQKMFLNLKFHRTWIRNVLAADQGERRLRTTKISKQIVAMLTLSFD